MKRSAQVVLVVMAATGIGATSMALMPRQDCSQVQPGEYQSSGCSSTSSRSGGSYSSYSHGSSGSSSSSSSSGTSFVGGTEHGGFGSSAHSFGAHASS
jgi:hypothetical protein